MLSHGKNFMRLNTSCQMAVMVVHDALVFDALVAGFGICMRSAPQVWDVG
jgi:hypothetical protein